MSDQAKVGIFKAALFKKWDTHLHAAHPHQWECEQKKKAKREAASQLRVP